MAIARITTPGLVSIAVLVAFLWACILGQHLIIQNANQEFSRALTEIKTLRVRQRMQPVSAPARPAARPPRPTIG
jgi:hypothetical protein